MPVALVTGANGFIGRHLCAALQRHGWRVKAVYRAGVEPTRPGDDVVWIALGDLASCAAAALADCCDGVDMVFHLAARAHRADVGRDATQAADYRRDNVEASVRLYDAAASRGVSRFVYVSSIKVLGDTSTVALKPDAPPAPQDVYATSKYQAEVELRDRAAPGTPVTVVRPPLVYGPGVRGNMAALLRWADGGWPLPLGNAAAKRSLVSVTNLTDLLTRLTERTARFEVLHVRDPEDLSVRELALAIARAIGRPARLVAVPPRFVAALSKALGRAHVYSSLFESLCVDDTATRESLRWRPPLSAEQAIAEMGRWWRTR